MLLNSVVNTFLEEEIIELLDKLEERLVDPEERKDYERIVNQIFFESNRIFSEDMVLKYISILNLEKVKNTYKSYIKSKQYSRLALYLISQG